MCACASLPVIIRSYRTGNSCQHFLNTDHSIDELLQYRQYSRFSILATAMSKLVPTELAAPIPDLADKAKQQGLELTPPQQKAVDEVVAHFSSPDYTLSGLKEGQDGALLEEEKFWLVRRRQALIISCSIMSRIVHSRMNACSGEYITIPNMRSSYLIAGISVLPNGRAPALLSNASKTRSGGVASLASMTNATHQHM